MNVLAREVLSGITMRLWQSGKVSEARCGLQMWVKRKDKKYLEVSVLKKNRKS